VCLSYSYTSSLLSLKGEEIQFSVPSAQSYGKTLNSRIKEDNVGPCSSTVKVTFFTRLSVDPVCFVYLVNGLGPSSE